MFDSFNKYDFHIIKLWCFPSEDQQIWCQFHTTMGEFGVYDMSVSPESDGNNCSFQTAKEPVNIYTRKPTF